MQDRYFPYTDLSGSWSVDKAYPMQQSQDSGSCAW